jgi:hypothetical protein
VTALGRADRVSDVEGRGTGAAPTAVGRIALGLDGNRDELRGLRVYDDVPVERHAADDLPGVRGRVARADGGMVVAHHLL